MTEKQRAVSWGVTLAGWVCGAPVSEEALYRVRQFGSLIQT
jgi:hypothetical protein